MGIIKLLKNSLIGLLILSAFLLVSCSNPRNNSASNGNKVNNQSLPNGDSTPKLEETISQTTNGNPSSSEVITDIANWNHPVKDVLNKYNIRIMKIELLNNKQYPIFNVEFDPVYRLDTQGAKYFDTLLKSIASANGYWNFKVVDDKNKFVFDVECNKEKKNVIEIVVNGKSSLLKEMIDYNGQMVNNWDKATEYLTKAVPEIKQFEEQLSKDSTGKVTLTMRLDGVPDKYSDSQYKDFYCIYVGENHPDHTVRWNTFYVNEDLNKIMVEGIITGDLITLEQWRKENANKVSEPSKAADKGMKISEDEAITIINDLIRENKIILTQPNCEVQNFGTTTEDNMSYYIIRIAYIDPNNKEYTTTLARYWVSDTTGEVFQEDLWTGNISKVSFD